MAAPPDRFRAHDRCRSGFASESEKAFNAFPEFLVLHVIGVTAKRRVAPCAVTRVRFRFSSSAKLGEMFVAYSVGAQRFRQGFPVELRITLRPRPRPHVGQQLDSALFQQCDEAVDAAR